MKLTIFGATGRSRKLLMKQALEAGHVDINLLAWERMQVLIKSQDWNASANK